jgi:hypothetical protein
VLERVAEEAGAERAKPDDPDFDETIAVFVGGPRRATRVE